jgi:hypothetical protein
MEDKENQGPGLCSPQNSPSVHTLNAKKHSAFISDSPNGSPQAHIAVKKNFSPKKTYSPKNHTALATPKPNRGQLVQFYKESLNSPFKESPTRRSDLVHSPVSFVHSASSPKRHTPQAVYSPSPVLLSPTARHSPTFTRLAHLSPSLSPLAWHSKLQSPKFLAEHEHPLAPKPQQQQSAIDDASSVEASAKHKMWESVVDDWTEWNSLTNKNKLRNLIILQVPDSLRISFFILFSFAFSLFVVCFTI